MHSQTLRASASEVAIRHGTTRKVEGNYVDAHGQSQIGFGITRLLGFEHDIRARLQWKGTALWHVALVMCMDPHDFRRHAALGLLLAEAASTLHYI